MTLLENMRIGKRLFVGFGIQVGALVLLLVASQWSLDRIDSISDEVADLSRGVQRARELKSSVDSVAFQVANVLFHSAAAVSQEEILEHREIIEVNRGKYSKLLDELKAQATTDEDKRQLSKLEERIDEVRKVHSKVLELASSGKVAEATTLFLKNATPLNQKLEKALDEMLAWRARSTADKERQAHSLIVTLSRSFLIGGLFIAVFGIYISIFITRSITRPILRVSKHLQEMAKGDFSIAVKEGAKQRKDEMGDLACALSALNENMRKTVGDITKSVHTLAASSTELSVIASQSDQGSRQTSDRANTVAATAEEMSTTLASVSTGMEQMATSVNTIVTAVEEMTATIGDIAHNSEKARTITTGAVLQTQQISQLMRDLGNAAQEIGKVTETITAISAQTNLLALNATIEAARAGTAGKGFAVVANEIKELARQTATATEDIKAKIQGIQTSTASTVGDIQKISQVVQEVNDIVTTIAASIEEQSTVTRDIASYSTQTAQSINDATNRLGQSTTVAQGIARDIAEVNHSAHEIADGSTQVRSSAQELSRLSEQLDGMVGRFKVS